MAKNNKPTRRVAVDDEIWRKVKSQAALEGKPTYQWVEEAIVEKLNNKPVN